MRLGLDRRDYYYVRRCGVLTMRRLAVKRERVFLPRDLTVLENSVCLFADVPGTKVGYFLALDSRDPV